MSKKFKFQSVVLDHARPLGSGYYGNTYQAHCDHLLCAGKHMTPELFEVEKETRGRRETKIKKSLIAAFQHDVESLRRCICHPNLVQYLGTYPDPDSGLPILIMELCQDNLSTYLDKSFDSLAYHTQLNLLHDVALALVFLHAHDIVHGNLSSNNVFVVPYRLPRAKVSDYGICRMSSVVKNNLTCYRGNTAYLPPHPLICLIKNAAKVDSYSWGVLATQVLTHQLPLPPPKPSEQVKGGQSMNIEEHHQSILALVNSGNPLLSIVKSSLRQLDGHRPPSEVISYSLAELKADRLYTESLEKDNKTAADQQQLKLEEKSGDGGGGGGGGGGRMSGTSKLKKELRESKMEVDKLRKELFSSKKKSKMQPALKPTFSEDAISSSESKTKAGYQRSQSYRDDDHLKRYGTSVPLLESTNCFLQSSNSSRDILGSYATDIGGGSMREETLSIGANSLRAKSSSRGLELDFVGEEVTTDMVEKPEKRSAEETDSVEHTGAPQHSSATMESSSKKKRWSLLRKSSTLPDMHTHPNVPSLTVRVGTSSLSAMIRGYSAVDEEGKAYFASFSSSDKRIYTCKVHKTSKNLSWLVIPECPNIEFGLALVNNSITAVGGYKHEYRPSQPTNVLLTYSEIRRQWTERFPPMATKRRLPAVVATRTLLVVAGGNGEGNEILSTVEVMNLQTMNWSMAAPLPMALTHVSATILNDCIHIAGGQNSMGPTNAHFYSDIKYTSGVFGKEEVSPWKKGYKTPTLWCTLAAISGHLLALGGQDDNKNCSSGIFMYDPRSDVWVKVGHMRHKRSACLVAVPNGEGYGGMMVVVGGFVRKNEATNAAEIISCTSTQ